MSLIIELSGGEKLTIENDIDWAFATNRDEAKVKVSQNIREFDKWVTWIKQEFPQDKPFKYLEIGSYAGESLWYLSQIFPKGSEITLVDLGDNHTARGILIPTIEMIQEKFDHKITLLSGFSDDPKLLQEVAKSAPYDMVFIDANHDFEWAYKDFMNYRDKAKWIAFHDISEFNILKTKIKYGKELANAAHIWKSITSVIPQVEKYPAPNHFRSTPDDVEEVTNWLQFIDYDNDTDITKMVLKPKGIGLLRSQW